MLRAAVIFLLAVLTGLGVGSAGLFVLYLTLCEGYAQLRAQAVNLLFFMLASLAALLFYLRRTPPAWWALAFLLPTGLLGVLLGSALADKLPQDTLRTVFAVFLMLCGGLGLFFGHKG
jgi:uncharacterized membrane protein YfcA